MLTGSAAILAATDARGVSAMLKGFITNHLYELVLTLRSLLSAGLDSLILHTRFFHKKKKSGTFAFLVHPRTSEFHHNDDYGRNDIFRPFRALNWLTYFGEPGKATARILSFAKWINPITLSRITVRLNDGTKRRGYLLSTVRTPEQLFRTDARDSRRHLGELFELARRKGVGRVGLGALLPSLTGYGTKFTKTDISERPAVSTGHGYTAYTIVEYLRFLISKRNLGRSVVRVAIMGAAGSTGKATLRMLARTWNESTSIELVLVDVPGKEFPLQGLLREACATGRLSSVSTSTNPNALRECQYVVVVTNAEGLTVLPEHLQAGTVVIDDSQPRNTSQHLETYGIHVLDVLARVPGLDCGFDFGFRTSDKSVTFTCLAETVLAAATGMEADLAVGEVGEDTITRVLEMVRKARRLGLVGPLPFFSFGRELSDREIDEVLQPVRIKLAPAAE